MSDLVARCQSCGQTGEAHRFADLDGSRPVNLCADREACRRRMRRMDEVERDGAAEARTWFPEPDDEDEEDAIYTGEDTTP